MSDQKLPFDTLPCPRCTSHQPPGCVSPSGCPTCKRSLNLPKVAHADRWDGYVSEKAEMTCGVCGADSTTFQDSPSHFMGMDCARHGCAQTNSFLPKDQSYLETWTVHKQPDGGYQWIPK